MVELRDKRNEKVHKYLGVWVDPYKVDKESVIIESSQVAAAYVIRKAMNKWKANKLKKEEESRSKNQSGEFQSPNIKIKKIAPNPTASKGKKVMPLIKESENEERDSNHGHSQRIQQNVGQINEFINNEAIGVHKQPTPQEGEDKQRLMTEEDRASPGFAPIRENAQSRSDRQLNDNFMRSSVGKNDSIPGNKQGEEVANNPEASSMGYSDAHVLNSVNQNNPH